MDFPIFMLGFMVELFDYSLKILVVDSIFKEIEIITF